MGCLVSQTEINTEWRIDNITSLLKVNYSTKTQGLPLGREWTNALTWSQLKSNTVHETNHLCVQSMQLRC